MRVTSADLRRLLDSDLPEPALILVGGELRVVAAGGEDHPDGAMVVTTAAELRAKVAGKPEPDEDELRLAASVLDTMVVQRGA
ncbi:hypothetical protein [Amycolatopsis sp. NPDC052450]|uniref:hypothetical protein n=1 Tax=Amycolatopsis sp. NPDC052450 TaxID=3363937 RepID=UPI0037C91956